MPIMQNDQIIDSNLRVLYSSHKVAATIALSSAIGPLLEICVAQTNSHGAYVYRFDGGDHVLELIAWRGSHPTDIPSYSAQVDGRVSSWYRDLNANAVIEKNAWQDWRFQNLPEFLQNRFESAVSIPILEGGKLSGIANFCHRPATQYTAEQIGFLAGLSLPLGSLLAKARLESELEETNRNWRIASYWTAPRGSFRRASGGPRRKLTITSDAPVVRPARPCEASRSTSFIIPYFRLAGRRPNFVTNSLPTRMEFVSFRQGCKSELIWARRCRYDSRSWRPRG